MIKSVEMYGCTRIAPWIRTIGAVRQSMKLIGADIFSVSVEWIMKDKAVSQRLRPCASANQQIYKHNQSFHCIWILQLSNIESYFIPLLTIKKLEISRAFPLDDPIAKLVISSRQHFFKSNVVISRGHPSWNQGLPPYPLQGVPWNTVQSLRGPVSASPFPYIPRKAHQ